MRLFRRPDVPLRLMYGKDRISAPRYDLQLLAPQVMGRLAEEVMAGPEQRFGESASATDVEMVPPVVFWSVLALAVLVLLVLIARIDAQGTLSSDVTSRLGRVRPALRTPARVDRSDPTVLPCRTSASIRSARFAS